jgi:hypothetical protein
MAIASEDYLPSYWLLGDDQLDISKNESEQSLFEASFKHSLLFNPSLLFSDSMTINNRNFRQLIENSAEFRELVNPTTFFIAVRENDNGDPTNLIELQHSFAQSQKFRVTELQNSDRGMTFLQESASKLPYSVNRIAGLFAEQSVNIFGTDEIQSRLPRNLWKDVQDLARQARDDLGEKYGLDFFFYHLDGLLSRRRPDMPVDRYMDDIKQIVQLPYVTALPTAVNTTSIYANKHSEAFEICGGRAEMVSVDGRPDVRAIKLRTGLANFGNGIALLSPDDILRLRNSDEAREYFYARSGIDIATFAESKRHFLDALGAYVRRIEDIIISRLATQSVGLDNMQVVFDVRENRKRGLIKALDYVPDVFTYVTVAADLLGKLVGFDLSVPAYLSMLFVNPVKDVVAAGLTGETSTQMAVKAENRRNMKKDEITEQWDGSERIPAEITVFRGAGGGTRGETRYTSGKII